MKAATIALAVMATAAFAGKADAQQCRTHEQRHCDACVKILEYTTLEKREVTTYEDVFVGYQDQVVRYEDVITGYQNVWVERQVTDYETRRVLKRVYVGKDCCGKPIYRNQWVCERVPVCRTVRVCEKQPICEQRPICEKRPVYEKRAVTKCEWVNVPHAIFFCWGR